MNRKTKFRAYINEAQIMIDCAGILHDSSVLQDNFRKYEKWVERPIGKSGPSTSYSPYQWAYSFKDAEVIGNIFENQELIQQYE